MWLIREYDLKFKIIWGTSCFPNNKIDHDFLPSLSPLYEITISTWHSNITCRLRLKYERVCWRTIEIQDSDWFRKTLDTRKGRNTRKTRNLQDNSIINPHSARTMIMNGLIVQDTTKNHNFMMLERPHNKRTKKAMY